MSLRYVALVLLLALAACAPDAGPDADLLSGLGDKADSVANTPEGRAILAQLEALQPEMRRLKAELVIGETHDGYLAIVPQAAERLAVDAALEADAQQLIASVNDTRDKWYDLQVEKYTNEVLRSVDEQLVEIRRQVTDQVCARIPLGVDCSQVAGDQIEQAVKEATAEVLREQLRVIKSAVQDAHADYWMTKHTKSGEWIELGDRVKGWYWTPKQ